MSSWQRPSPCYRSLQQHCRAQIKTLGRHVTPTASKTSLQRTPKPIKRQKGRNGFDRTESKRNQQQCLGTGQLPLVLVILFQQKKDLKQWRCHSPFFSIGNTPVAQVKLMPGVPGTENSWLQEERTRAKTHLHHSISFPLALAEMCFLMWLTGL